MPDTSSPLSHTQSLLLATFRTLIKPMIRLFLAKGVTYPLILEAIKRCFVEVAEEEFQIAGKGQTDSRLTLLTGIHRRDVHRIRNEPLPKGSTKPNLSAQIMVQWLTNPRYLTQQGQPKPLARSQKNNADDSFESLVASVSKDIRARPVLDEWLRTGTVSLDAEGLIQLHSEVFIPSSDLNDRLFFLGMNMHDHLAAAVNNTLHSEKMFERSVHYDALSVADVQHLHSWMQEHGLSLLKSANQQARKLTEQHASAKTDGEQYRMNTGLYFYYEKVPAATLESPDADRHPQ